MVESSDTVREVTTITIVLRQAQEPDEAPDTLKISTVTDRTTVRNRDRTQYRTESVEERVDTVYVENEAEKTVAAVGPNTEIDEQGNVTKRVNRFAQSLKWLFLTLVAFIILIIIIKLKIIK